MSQGGSHAPGTYTNKLLYYFTKGATLHVGFICCLLEWHSEQSVPGYCMVNITVCNNALCRSSHRQNSMCNINYSLLSRVLLAIYSYIAQPIMIYSLLIYS